MVELSDNHPKGVRVFTSADGITIYVGKNAEANDILSLETAEPQEWWMHVMSESGSHVVVRGLHLILPLETKLDAAHLAVYYSKARNATRAVVTVSQAKYVTKRFGQPPGQVLVSNREEFQIRIEQKRLERLLGRSLEN